jgi:hypothetical protein
MHLLISVKWLDVKRSLLHTQNVRIFSYLKRVLVGRTFDGKEFE